MTTEPAAAPSKVDPLRAHGFLVAACHLLQQALEASAADIQGEIYALVNLTEVEIDHAAQVLALQANREIAKRLGPGFDFDPYG